MSELKHTPGPWEVSPDNDWECGVTTSEEAVFINVERMGNANHCRDELYATARLISAAPDMLAVLQFAMQIRDLWGAPSDALVEPSRYSLSERQEMQPLLELECQIATAIAKATAP
jgi:hypothetical protein